MQLLQVWHLQVRRVPVLRLRQLRLRRLKDAAGPGDLRLVTLMCRAAVTPLVRQPGNPRDLCPRLVT